jgi:hypothetical protein
MTLWFNSRFKNIFVLATPVPPVIKNVQMLSKSAVVAWERGDDGGSVQTLEIWYRLSNSNDRHWKTIRHIPAGVTTYTIYNLKPQQSYLFSMRGLNKMGFGVFSRIFRSDKFSSANYHNEKGKGNFFQESRAIDPKNFRICFAYMIMDQICTR